MFYTSSYVQNMLEYIACLVVYSYCVRLMLLVLCHVTVQSLKVLNLIIGYFTKTDLGGFFDFMRIQFNEKFMKMKNAFCHFLISSWCVCLP